MANPRRYLNTHAKRIPQPCPGKCLPSRCSYSSRIDERVIIRFPPLSLSLRERESKQQTIVVRWRSMQNYFPYPVHVYICVRACVCLSGVISNDGSFIVTVWSVFPHVKRTTFPVSFTGQPLFSDVLFSRRSRGKERRGSDHSPFLFSLFFFSKE